MKKKKSKRLFLNNWNGIKIYCINKVGGNKIGEDYWNVRFQNAGIGCNVMQLMLVHDLLVMEGYTPTADSESFEHEGKLVR